MAWFKNGRKYWKHNGRIYSSKIKRNSSSSSGGFFSFFLPEFDKPRKLNNKEQKIMNEWKIVENEYGVSYWENKKTGLKYEYKKYHPLHGEYK